MAQIAPVILADGQATPANKTFIPQTPQQGTSPSVWYEKSSGSLVTYRKLQASVVQNANQVTKVRFTISDPIPASMSAACCTDGMPLVAYTDLVSIEFSLPKSSTIANRKDILAYAKNFLSNAVATSAVVDLEPTW